MVEEKLQELQEELTEIKDLLKQERTKEVFKAQEAAEYLQISYDSLMRYAKTGLIRVANNGKSRIFKRAWLDEWLERGGTR